MGLLELIGALRRRDVREAIKTGIEDDIRREWVAQVVEFAPKGGRWELELDVYTGDESPWQAPQRQRVVTRAPDGIEPHAGQRLVVKPPRHADGHFEVLWDRPEPELPPMQLPQIPRGDDPEVMLRHLEGLVDAGALDREGLERARAYLAQRAG